MQRSTQKHGLLNFLSLIGLAVTAYAVGQVGGSLAGRLSAVFLGLGALVAAVSWFQMRLEENERLEKLELDELARSKTSSTIFESKEGEIFPAQRSREQFERFFVPGFTVILFLAQAAGAWLLWRWVAAAPAPVEGARPMMPMFIFGLFFLLLFMLGRFSATIARLENHRLLKPSASWQLFNAFLCGTVALGLLGVLLGYPRMDLYVARGLSILLGLIALETLINLTLEIYRPRVKGQVARPLYESRLVGLLGQPEGLITTAAQALDYQFGFKVSETWFYRFFEKAAGWLILLQLVALLLSTTVVFIEPGEQGLLERFGRPVEGRSLLGPGAHVKWPWFIDRIHRFQTEQIQSFNIGFTPDGTDDHETAVLWSVAHAKEDNFLVANRDTTVSTNDASGRRTPPVSLLTVNIPVQFQITNLPAWVYNNENPTNLIQSVATREVVRYLVSADFNEIMSSRRLEAAHILQERIQKAVDERALGARIVFVGLQGIHPPVAVAGEFEKVVGASQTRQARVLAAQADAIRTNALASAHSAQMLNQAEADRVTREIAALARVSLFTNQIPAFLAAPTIYPERAYLLTFVEAVANARKYVLLVTNTSDVIQYDLQDRVREDLLNLSVPTQQRR